MQNVSNLHVAANRALPTPRELLGELPLLETDAAFVARVRREVAGILAGEDARFLLVVGPCSIHDVQAGREYAERLAQVARRVRDRLLVVMRVYFEKPRTTVGWKGLVMDPHLDGSNDIQEGLRLGRAFLREVVGLGLPTATELLDPITPQYIADYLCWAAIGARTTESQTHRQMASGLSMPVGFKNTTSGALLPAVHGVMAASQPQTFLGIDEDGRASVVSTTGNGACHVILRGGDTGPNHDGESVDRALALLEKHRLPARLMIDASHANCAKDPGKMPGVFREILRLRASGVRGIMGAMLESNLLAGAQRFPQPKESLIYGQSITDPCIAWETTEALIEESFASLA